MKIKIKLKFIMLFILALLFISCRGIKERPLVYSFSDSIIIGELNGNKGEPIELTYDEKEMKKLNKDFNEKELKINKDIHLKFKSDEEVIQFRNIFNMGNMYFDEKRDESGDYTIVVGKKDLKNAGKIVVYDGNKGSTLNILGNYRTFGENSIELGLYPSKDGNKFSTDKIFIDGEVVELHSKTEVKFIYDKEEIKQLKETATSVDDYVIKVEKGAPNYITKGKFLLKDTIPVGSKSFELKHEYTKEGNDIWKLQIKD